MTTGFEFVEDILSNPNVYNASLADMEENSLILMAGAYDVFLDFSAYSSTRHDPKEIVYDIRCCAGLLAPDRIVTLALPTSSDAAALTVPGLKILTADTRRVIRALHFAGKRASSQGRHLAILTNLVAGNELLARMAAEFGMDPMLGIVQPRFGNASTDRVIPLPIADEPISLPLPRNSMYRLPVRTITPEFVSACLMLNRRTLEDMDLLTAEASSVVFALRVFLTQIRRRGFRNVVLNHLAVPCHCPPDDVYPPLQPSDLSFLQGIYPETSTVESWRKHLSQGSLERIMASSFRQGSKEHPRLLLDCRGMSPQHNGTSHSMLGFLSGFDALQTHWDIDVLVSSGAEGFFALKERYRHLRLVLEHSRDCYAAAVMLNQPWGISRVAELHQHALLMFFHMLDTIAWDIMYVCDERLDALWRFIARYADGLFYLSDFTQQRFHYRFAPPAHIVECVTYLSLAADEQMIPNVATTSKGHILVFGNDYDHKDTRRSLEVLADAFPYQSFVAIGIEYPERSNIKAIPSGKIEDAVLHGLISQAHLVVFPSFYEGFGMPVVQSMAYGKTVVVRHSILWAEIAARLCMTGQLVQFQDVVSLIEVVGRMLRGLSIAALPQGASLDPAGQVLRWKDCAQRVLDTVEKAFSDSSSQKWEERETVLRCIQLLEC